MTTDRQELPDEVKAALDDLQRIREVVDIAREDHPLRRIARPLMLYSIIGGLASAAFGVTAQLILDRGPDSIAGLSPVAAVWLLGALFGLVALAIKNVVIASASRQAGYDLALVLRSIFNRAYLRVMLSLFSLVILGSVALAMHGAAHMILGLLTLGVGAVWFILPLLFPMQEFSYLGAVLMALGALAMFLFPEWTFYKLALIWGGPLSVGGLILYRRFPPLPDAPGRRE